MKSKIKGRGRKVSVDIDISKLHHKMYTENKTFASACKELGLARQTVSQRLNKMNVKIKTGLDIFLK